MMKNIKRFSVGIIALILVVFTSCNDTSETFTISAPTAPVLANLNFAKLELDAVNTNNPAIALNWKKADYGVQASVNYAIQFSNDDVFTNPTTAATITGQTSITLSVNEVNSAAGNAGLNPFEWKKVYIRVISSLGTQNNQTSASNTIEVEVYPYFNYVFEDYFLVGNATSNGWNNNSIDNHPALYRDENDSNVFYYTGYFDKASPNDGDGRFKVLEDKGSWSNQWGTTYPDGNDPIEATGDIAGNPATQSNDPGRFGVSASGFYTFMINFATNEFKIESFDASGKTSPASLSLQGSSTANVAMTPLAFDGHIWYATGVKLTPGSVEFVTGAGAKWGNTTSFSGVATDGGGAVPVIVEDDYDVWFNDLTGRYILIPLNL